MNFPDLEIRLGATQDKDIYDVGLSFSDSDADAESDPGRFASIHIDFESLRRLQFDDPGVYGRKLTNTLFAEPAMLAWFSKCRGIAEENGQQLRIRIFIEPQAERLHELRWECLADPEAVDRLLATNENVLLSRYLSSRETRPLRMRRPNETRAFVFIANPTDVEEYDPNGQQLHSIDSDGEWARTRDALKPMPVTRLQPGCHATLDTLVESLRVKSDKLTDGVSVLYLICHGALIKNEPYIVLEKSDGKTDMIRGEDLVTRLRDLERHPRLVVLASCQSAGKGIERQNDGQSVLAALGPRLADAGIPAVLAMQGSVTMETIREFMPIFFRELRRHGIIDLALSVARGAVREQHDWWMPVLFMRLRHGRIWAGTQTYSDATVFDGWPHLLDSIMEGKCTPILGPRLTDGLLGTHRDIAKGLAERFDLPLDREDLMNLPEVLQYLQMEDRANIAPRALLQIICKTMKDICGESLRPDIYSLDPDTLPEEDLHSLFAQLEQAVWEKRLEENPFEPHLILAQLPLPIYLQTTPDGLMTRALRDRRIGKQPVIDICRWNDQLAALPSFYADKEVSQNYRPSRQHPFVFHFFGLVDKPDYLIEGHPNPSQIKSAVLTEDDYFDFLLGFGRRNIISNGSKNTENEKKEMSNYIPLFVRSAMTNTKLLFLGFPLNDWSFRVLFRCIKIMEGSSGLNNNTHIAVQIEPKEGRKVDLQRAHNYLVKYFDVNSVSIRFYWKPVEDFIKDLYSHLYSE